MVVSQAKLKYLPYVKNRIEARAIEAPHTLSKQLPANWWGLFTYVEPGVKM